MNLQPQVTLPSDRRDLTPWLAEAAKITSGDRRRDYGRPLLNFLRIAISWSNYLDFTITPAQVAFMMVLMKVAREQNTPKNDNPIDILGYMACLSDMDDHLKGMGYESGYYYLNGMSVVGMQTLYERVLRDKNRELTAQQKVVADWVDELIFHEPNPEKG